MTPGGRARVRAWADEFGAARRRARLVRPASLANFWRRCRETAERWWAIDTAPGRLFPWLPVAYGIGIVIYFAVPREPAVWAVAVLAVMSFTFIYAARNRSLGFSIVLALSAAAIGFSFVTIKTALIAHPVLAFPVSGVSVSGFVEVREERARSDRIVVRVHDMSGQRTNPKLDRVRVAVRKGSAPAVGEFVTFKARLSPPLTPLRPGGYDFARDMFFQRIGASGFALGAVKAVPAPGGSGLWLRYAATVDGIRSAIDRRIRDVLSGDRGSIASALITGKRDAISVPVNDAMYVSSLAHVLSISGYHMAVVAGIVFFLIRAGLALIPSVASRRPIKKWAAIVALMSATFYLLLSGAEIATQRSYIMIAIVLAGVMFDRPAITFRTLAIAAFGVLLLAPEAVVHPSFQMSFAATLALVAVYNAGANWRPAADSSFGARAALWGGREITALLLASLVAGLATMPYAAFHFHRLAPYGVIANLLAMPVVSAWVMPMGILGVVALPFGLDGVFWELMGLGLDWMVAVAMWVTGLPGAVGRIHAFGTSPLLVATAAILVSCMLRSPLRWGGAALAVAACAAVYVTPRPDIFISPDGRSAAFRRADGRLSMMQTGRDIFATREWLAADGDGRLPDDVDLRRDVQCDDIGCVGTLADGRKISITTNIQGLIEDCSISSITISPRMGVDGCQAMLVDRRIWRHTGAMALRVTKDGFLVKPDRQSGQERPWTPRTGLNSVLGRPAPARPTQDATPRVDDLEAGDAASGTDQ